MLEELNYHTMEEEETYAISTGQFKHVHQLSRNRNSDLKPTILKIFERIPSSLCYAYSDSFARAVQTIEQTSLHLVSQLFRPIAVEIDLITALQESIMLEPAPQWLIDWENYEKGLEKLGIRRCRPMYTRTLISKNSKLEDSEECNRKLEISQDFAQTGVSTLLWKQQQKIHVSNGKQKHTRFRDDEKIETPEFQFDGYDFPPLTSTSRSDTLAKISSDQQNDEKLDTRANMLSESFQMCH